MKRAFAASTLLILLVLLIAAGCGSSGNLATADAQRQFGVRMAKMNLWREAMFRFKRAVEIEPDNAMAHNNLAVAYEAIGDFDNAAKEYREALRLDRSNEHIQKNYSRYVEFTSRSKKRPPKPVTTAATDTTATTSTATTSTATTSTDVAPPVSSAPPPTDTSATSPAPETSTAPPPPPGELR